MTSVASKPVVKFTANFERNLEEIERFLTEADAPQAIDGLLDALLETVIPSLERFPNIGCAFARRQVRSVEAAHARGPRFQLSALTPDVDAIREYVLKHYLLLDAPIGGRSSPRHPAPAATLFRFRRALGSMPLTPGA